MKIIDFEAHFYVEELLQAMVGRNTYPTFDPEKRLIRYTYDNSLPIRDILLLENEAACEQRLRDMDANGVETEVIGLCAGLEELPPDEQLRLAPIINDTAYRICQRNPGRFIAYAALPVLDAEASARELERCVKELGFIGWQAFSNFGDNGYLDEPRFYPILEKCAQLGVPVYIHPAEPHEPRYAGFGKFLCSNALGGAQNTIVVLMRLMLSGVFDKLPNLQVMIGHFGEGMAFYIERIDAVIQKSPEAANYCKRTPSQYFKDNIFMTTSGYMCTGGVQCVKSVCGVQRVLFGSDYPMEHSMAPQVNFLKQTEVLNEDEKSAIFYGNARQMLGV